MERSIRLGSAALIILSLLLGGLVARDIERRVGRAFPGFFVFANGVVGPTFLAPRPEAAAAGLRYHDRIVAVDGRPLAGGTALWTIVDAVGPGAPLRYTVERPGGGTLDVVVPTQLFTRGDFVRVVLPFLLSPVLLLAVVAVPVLVRPGLDTARVLFLWGWANATNYGFLVFDYFFGYRTQPQSYVADFLTQAALLHLAAIFPARRWPFSRHPRLALWLLYGTIAVPNLAFVIGVYRAPLWAYYLDGVALLTMLAGYGLLTANVAHTAIASGDPIRRQQARVVLTGPTLMLVVFALLVVTTWGAWDFGIPIGAYVLLLWVVPVSIAYAMLAHNLFEFDVVVRRGLALGIVVLGAAVAYLAAFWALQQWAGQGAAWALALLSLVFVLVLALAVEPLRRRVETIVEHALFPDHRRATVAIHEASREIARLKDADQVGRLLREALALAVRGERVWICVGPRDGALRELAPAADGPPLELAAADPLAELFRRGETRSLEEDDQLPLVLRRRLEQLGIRLVVPLPLREQMLGGFLLGPRADGRLYTSDDQAAIETLAAQAAVAVENARALEEIKALQRRLAAENVYLRQEIALRHDFAEIVGESPAIRAVLAQVEQVGPTDATVLVQGETGTGKELVVRALHATSRRRERVLVRVACAAIPETLLESELFGHERGAFTGAVARQLGRFEVADGGTLFLDDVDTLPLTVQAKLLRATQEGEVQRLGSPATRHVDVRVIAATNRDLAAEVRAGRFREDLYYRLNVVPIAVPALRERSEDIPLLVGHFWHESAPRRAGGSPRSPRRPWPRW